MVTEILAVKEIVIGLLTAYSIFSTLWGKKQRKEKITVLNSLETAKEVSSTIINVIDEYKDSEKVLISLVKGHLPPNYRPIRKLIKAKVEGSDIEEPLKAAISETRDYANRPSYGFGA